MLELSNVSKRVGRLDHISDVSLAFERGSLNVLLGPTLSGKTTLMRLMAGLDKPTDGDISIDGNSVLGTSVRNRNVAMVYQQFINYPGLTVYENIASPMRLAKVDKTTLDKKVREAAELLKLDPYLDRTPLNLSGGQQQRTAIARALVKGAELVLLDEPLANLDYKLREELRVELPRIFAETGAIFVYATTEPQEALLLGGRTATLSEGRVTQFGETIDVYNRPVNLSTAQTFSDPPFNVAAVNKAGPEIRIGEQRLCEVSANTQNLPDDQYFAALRPHHVSLSATSRHSVEIPATVGTSEITGSETFIHVNACGNSWVVLTHGIHRVNSGDTITLHIDPDTVYLFDKEEALIQAPTPGGD
ncbi:MAG: ABC transporter ATP-binding protein [Gammaproteobacteria bacterium]|nr:ABC transporter ATP-binding protein [Gammaproteobacteria bacterium]